ncbi:hypothetical protein M0R72_11145 [Candidatus Pacearchaeota archaeon]|nr:hypothetical protein [Candidatus Pacearchaeota archaeon]
MRLDPIYLWFGFLAICIGIISLACLLPIGDAVCLEVRGNATGQGMHTLEVLPDLVNLTSAEATYLLGPGYGYNVSKNGLVTFTNGSSWQIIQCCGSEA